MPCVGCTSSAVPWCLSGSAVAHTCTLHHQHTHQHAHVPGAWWLNPTRTLVRRFRRCKRDCPFCRPPGPTDHLSRMEHVTSSLHHHYIIITTSLHHHCTDCTNHSGPGPRPESFRARREIFHWCWSPPASISAALICTFPPQKRRMTLQQWRGRARPAARRHPWSGMHIRDLRAEITDMPRLEVPRPELDRAVLAAADEPLRRAGQRNHGILCCSQAQ